MIRSIRQTFNAAFTKEKYEAYLDELNSFHPGDIEFRVAETPIFVDKEFTQKILDACEGIVDVILRPDFKELTEPSIPHNIRMHGETEYPECIAFDFGICRNDDGTYSPQLIEMQGFPTLFAYQVLHTEITKKHFPPPPGFDSYLNGYDAGSYIKLLKDIILGDHNPEEVVLLEVYPDQQKTRIDFRCTKDYIGIETICVTDLKADGKKLYFEKNGERKDIKRIYNRVIFDDLHKQELPEGTLDIREDWDVEWCPHPHWFYRISKYTLPFIDSPYVPKTYFLDKLDKLPGDLENYVLKPLFSFAGQGVKIDITLQDIEEIEDPSNWILQKKVTYADAIETPDVPAKGEIRVFYFWPKNAKRPFAAQNLARLSKGKMIGVR
ncbi:MAG: hypothetical protein MUE71_05530, partial [Chitinophagaceae bacterium]|nr:hypothetical protein [Chitinophagaceae bacterium]